MNRAVTLRDALAMDLDSICHIEHACFGNPWPADAYAQELQRVEGQLMVAVDLGGVVGFSCVWHVAGEAHLLRIAVDPTLRRRGLGRMLLRAVFARAQVAGCNQITLEVASANTPAIALYHEAGFTEIGRREGYYRTPPDDALVMRRMFATRRTARS
jgi:ribosomal-protein-alanine N-acetyltransferase